MVVPGCAAMAMAARTASSSASRRDRAIGVRDRAAQIRDHAVEIRDRTFAVPVIDAGDPLAVYGQLRFLHRMHESVESVS